MIPDVYEKQTSPGLLLRFIDAKAAGTVPDDLLNQALLLLPFSLLRKYASHSSLDIKKRIGRALSSRIRKLNNEAKKVANTLDGALLASGADSHPTFTRTDGSGPCDFGGGLASLVMMGHNAKDLMLIALESGSFLDAALILQLSAGVRKRYSAKFISAMSHRWSDIFLDKAGGGIDVEDTLRSIMVMGADELSDTMALLVELWSTPSDKKQKRLHSTFPPQSKKILETLAHYSPAAVRLLYEYERDNYERARQEEHNLANIVLGLITGVHMEPISSFYSKWIEVAPLIFDPVDVIGMVKKLVVSEDALSKEASDFLLLITSEYRNSQAVMEVVWRVLAVTLLMFQQRSTSAKTLSGNDNFPQTFRDRKLRYLSLSQKLLVLTPRTRACEVIVLTYHLLPFMSQSTWRGYQSLSGLLTRNLGKWFGVDDTAQPTTDFHPYALNIADFIFGAQGREAITLFGVLHPMDSHSGTVSAMQDLVQRLLVSPTPTFIQHTDAEPCP